MKNNPIKRSGVCIKEFENTDPATITNLVNFVRSWRINVNFANFENYLTAVFKPDAQNLGDLGKAIDILQDAIYGVIDKQENMTDVERDALGGCCPSALIELQSLLITYAKQIVGEKSAKNTFFKQNHTYIDEYEYHH